MVSSFVRFCFNQFVQADLRQICAHLPQSETSSKCLNAQLLGKLIIPYLSAVFTVQFLLFRFLKVQQ